MRRCESSVERGKRQAEAVERREPSGRSRAERAERKEPSGRPAD